MNTSNCWIPNIVCRIIKSSSIILEMKLTIADSTSTGKLFLYQIISTSEISSEICDTQLKIKTARSWSTHIRYIKVTSNDTDHSHLCFVLDDGSAWVYIIEIPMGQAIIRSINDPSNRIQQILIPVLFL